MPGTGGQYFDVSTEKDDRVIPSPIQAGDILDSITDAFVSLDRDWRIVTINRECARISGKPPKDFIGLSHWTVWPESVGTIVEREYRRAVAEQVPVHFEFFYPGSYNIWLDIHAYPSMSGLNILYHDVTERKRVEQERERMAVALKQRVEEIETILSVLPIPVAIAEDPECQHLRLNPAFVSLLNLARSQDVPAHVNDRAATPFTVVQNGLKLADQELPMHKAARFGVEVCDMEINFGDDIADPRSLLGYAAPLFDENGAVRGAIGAFVEITERKKSEDALRGSEAKFRALVDANVIGIARGNDSMIVDANEKYLSIVGYTREDLVQGSVRWKEMTPPEYQEIDQEAYAEMLATGSCPPFEKAYIRKDGTLVHTLIGAAVTSRDPLEWMSFVLDLSERKQFEAQNTRLLRDIKDAAQTRQAFLKDVMRSVTEGKLVLCTEADELPPLLESSGEVISISKSDVATLRHQVISVSRGLLPEKRVMDLVTSVAEAAMNAVMHGGGGEACICTSPRGTVQVWIQDRGTGIEMERLPRATLDRGFSSTGTLGHGFWLMLSLIDRLWLLTGPTGTTLVLEQDRVQPEPRWLRQRLDS